MLRHHWIIKFYRLNTCKNVCFFHYTKHNIHYNSTKHLQYVHMHCIDNYMTSWKGAKDFLSMFLQRKPCYSTGSRHQSLDSGHGSNVNTFKIMIIITLVVCRFYWYMGQLLTFIWKALSIQICTVFGCMLPVHRIKRFILSQCKTTTTTTKN